MLPSASMQVEACSQIVVTVLDIGTLISVVPWVFRSQGYCIPKYEEIIRNATLCLLPFCFIFYIAEGVHKKGLVCPECSDRVVRPTLSAWHTWSASLQSGTAISHWKLGLGWPRNFQNHLLLRSPSAICHNFKLRQLHEQHLEHILTSSHQTSVLSSCTELSCAFICEACWKSLVQRTCATNEICHINKIWSKISASWWRQETITKYQRSCLQETSDP